MSAWTAVIPNSCGMFLISDAVDKPLRPMANRFGGCFCLGSGPRFGGFVLFLLFASVSAGETQVWLGDLRVVAFGLVVAFVFVASIDLPTPRTFCPCTFVFPAYSHVRTEPLARRSATLEEKKLLGWASLAVPCLRCPAWLVSSLRTAEEYRLRRYAYGQTHLGNSGNT